MGIQALSNKYHIFLYICKRLISPFTEVIKVGNEKLLAGSPTKAVITDKDETRQGYDTSIQTGDDDDDAGAKQNIWDRWDEWE